MTRIIGTSYHCKSAEGQHQGRPILTFTSQLGYYSCSVNDTSSEPLASRIPYSSVALPSPVTECVGPRGLRFNESTVDLIHAYVQICKGSFHTHDEKMQSLIRLMTFRLSRSIVRLPSIGRT